MGSDLWMAEHETCPGRLMSLQVQMEALLAYTADEPLPDWARAWIENALAASQSRNCPGHGNGDDDE